MQHMLINIPVSMAAKSRIDVLTGWRAVAAYSVLLAHAIDGSFYYGGVSIFHPFDARLAYFGMSLFFVLSGFVIQYNYADSFGSENLASAGYKFFVARFARLYPLYAISIIASPLSNLSEHGWIVLAYLTLTQSWFNVQMAVFPPDWSVSTEWFFYFVFVPLTLLVAQIKWPTRALTVFSLLTFLGLSIVFIIAQAPLTNATHRWLWIDQTVSADAWLWITYFSPIVRLFEFVTGVLTAKVYTSLEHRPRLPSIGIRIAIFAAALWCIAVVVFPAITKLPPLANIATNFVYAPALAVLLLFSSLYKTRLSHFLSSPPMLLAGEISYSVYVWSFFVLGMLAAALTYQQPSPLAMAGSAVKVVVCISLTTVFAYGSYCLIETPSRRWVRTALAPSLQSRLTSARKFISLL